MDIKENYIIMNSYKEYLMLQKVCTDIRRVISLNIKFTDASYSQNSSSVSATLISNSK